MSTNTKIELYRIENPNIPSRPDGVTSHPDLVGQWFTPNLRTAMCYLRKSTQTSGKEGHKVVGGARLLVASVSTEDLPRYHVSAHPIAAGMDVEPDNYLLPNVDGTLPVEVVALDGIVAELRGKLANPRNIHEAQRRIEAALGARETS